MVDALIEAVKAWSDDPEEQDALLASARIRILESINDKKMANV